MIVAAFKDPVKDSKIENGIVSGELPFLDLRMVTGDQILTRHQLRAATAAVKRDLYRPDAQETSRVDKKQREKARYEG